MKLATLFETTPGADLQWYIRFMEERDIPQIQDLERKAFPTMRPFASYKREMQNKLARYFVAGRRSDDGREEVLGFAGLWLVIDEAHLLTIAVGDAYRRRGIGQALLLVALETAREEGCIFMTLEVRVSNADAIALYQKFGFKRVGLRRGYYADNREDAALMTVDGLQEDALGEKLAALRTSLISP